MQTKDIFLSEGAMKAASITAAVCGILSTALSYASGDWTLLNLFVEAVKVVISIALFLAFSRFRWDFMRGLMGAMLFTLLYQEAFHVLGELWGETTDFDLYLIMGVEGSLYLASATMSFMMTFIIIIDHLILEYSHAGNRFNMIFNQISILFKILLYLMLLIITGTLDLPVMQMIYTGMGYIADLAIIVMVICIESQLDDFKEIRRELMADRKEGAQ